MDQQNRKSLSKGVSSLYQSFITVNRCRFVVHFSDELRQFFP